MRGAVFELLMQHRLANRPVALVTRLSDGCQTLVDEQWLEGELTLSPLQLAQVRQMLSRDRSGLLEPDNATAVSERLFARSYVPPARLFIVGAVHIAQALAPMARLAGYDVTVIDPRRAFCQPQRFVDTRLCSDWPDEALESSRLDAQCAVVVLSHDPKIDDPALEVALRSPVFYIGALGSSRTHAQRLQRLAELVPEASLTRIHAPVGIALGGRAPAEIAVSVLAELIQVRYRGSAR